jgi:predicted nucleic acid-binding protein
MGERLAAGKRSARQTQENAAEAIAMKLLLDTTVLIDVLRNRKGRRELLADLVRAGHSLSTCALNIAEVYGGIRSGEEGRTEAFLAGLDEFVLEGRVARAAGRLKTTWGKKGRTIALADAIVAAIAIEKECSLLTDIRKDFPMPELRLYPLP